MSFDLHTYHDTLTQTHITQTHTLIDSWKLEKWVGLKALAALAKGPGLTASTHTESNLYSNSHKP